jgi:site-specific DNA-cytosine methylase
MPLYDVMPGAAPGPRRRRRLGLEPQQLRRQLTIVEFERPAPQIHCARLVARLQGWDDEWDWQLAGRKTAQYRQLGNAFPPPVAEAVGNHAGARTLRSAS